MDPFDPLNPMNQLWNAHDPRWKNMSKEEREEYERMHYRAAVGYIAALFLAIIIAGVISLFTSCGSPKTTERTTHLTTTVAERTDTVFRDRLIVRQDTSWRQELLRQFRSIRETSDTSRYVVQDTAGHVVREKVVIRLNRETTSESDRQALTVLTSRLELMDSTMRSMQQSLQHSDSLINLRQQTVVREVEKPLTHWQSFQLWAGRLAMVAVAVAVIVWLYRHRSKWLPWLRRIK